MDQKAVVGRLREMVKQSGMSQAEFARMLGVDPANLSKYLSGRLAVGDSLINRVSLETGIERDWLRTGTGPIRPQPTAEGRGAPVYDIDVAAGFAEFDRELTREHIIGYVELPDIDPRLPLVRASGSSMEPVIHDGALLSIRRVTVCPDIFWGQIYVVVLDDYRMVKYVRRCHADPQRVILHSANRDYDDMEVDLQSVRSLFLVENILNQHRQY